MASVQNVDRLKRRLAAMRDGPRKAMSQAIKENAEELSGAIRNVAPKGRTGALQRSIGWSWGNAPEGATLGGGANNRSEAKGILGAQGLAATVHAGDRQAWYARLVEFGTRPHKNKGLFEGTDHPGTRALGFFFGTYRLRKKSMLSRFSRAMRKAIKESVGKA